MCFRFLVLFFFTFPLFAGNWEVSLGPEVIYTDRRKEGGTHQEGVLGGIYLSCERISSNTFYLGGNLSYAVGPLEGKTGSGKTLQSTFQDLEMEGRLGYNLCDSHKALLTPFVGFGWIQDTNHFYGSSSLHCHFLDQVTYFSWGFLWRMQLTTRFRIGCNVDVKQMIHGECKVSHDPDEPPSTQVIGEESFCSAEFPIGYTLPIAKGCLTAIFEPFINLRHYGGRENYPFDFLDTKYGFYGARLLIDWRF